MPMSFFDDWDPCPECGLDHKYDFGQAAIRHREILIRKERDKQMEAQNKNEGYALKQDPSAYMYAAATAALMLAFVASIYFAW